MTETIKIAKSCFATDETNPLRGYWWLLNTLFGVASAGLVAFRAETFFNVVCFCAYAIFLLCIFTTRAVETESGVLDGSAKPLFLKIKHHATIFWVAIVLLVSTLAAQIAIHYIFRDEVFPLATIDSYEGTNVVMMKNQKMAFDVGGTQITLPDGRITIAFAAVNAMVISEGQDLRVKSVSVIARPSEAKPFTAAGLFPTDPFKPNIYYAKLERHEREYPAVLYVAGQPSQAVPRLAGEIKEQGIQAEFEGATGVYEVNLEIKVALKGREQVLKTKKPILVYVPKNSE